MGSPLLGLATIVFCVSKNIVYPIMSASEDNEISVERRQLAQSGNAQPIETPVNQRLSYNPYL